MKFNWKKIDQIIGDLSIIFGMSYYLHYERITIYGLSTFYGRDFISTFFVGVVLYVLIRSFGVKKIFPSF